MQTIELHPDRDPAATIIVLHGLGADGTDFLSFGDEMDLSAIGPVRWLLPRAPMRPVTINNGHVMRAWYDILGTELTNAGPAGSSPRGRQEDEAGLRESFGLVHALIEREIARGVPASRIVLGGFSQGCAIALGAGLRCAHRLAGLVGMSGYLPLADRLAAERHAANNDVPLFLAHGAHDGVVPLSRGSASRDALQSLGYAVEWHQYPMQHSVCLEEVHALQRWLLKVLA